MRTSLAGLFALVLAAFFSGAAVFISLIEQPARLLLDHRALLVEWQNTYPPAMRMQGGIAIAAGLAAAFAAWSSGDWRWLLGAALMLANWPYTLIALMPINHALTALAPEAASGSSRALIEQWGTLHGVRSGLGLLAVAAFVWPLATPRAAAVRTGQASAHGRT
jgi:hypothetical protein